MCTATNNEDTKGSRMLPASFKPTATEVIIGRGRRCVVHLGNRRFRALVQDELPAYSAASTKAKKSTVILRVLQAQRNISPNGLGFVKHDPATGRYLKVEDSQARITVAQAFRDALHTNYKSSKQQKQKRRREERGENWWTNEEEEAPISAPSDQAVLSQPAKRMCMEAPAASNALEDILFRQIKVNAMESLQFPSLSLAVAEQEDEDDDEPIGFPDITFDNHEEELAPASAAPAVSGEIDLVDSLLEAFGGEVYEDPYEPTPLDDAPLPMPSLAHFLEPTPLEDLVMMKPNFLSSFKLHMDDTTFDCHRPNCNTKAAMSA